MGRAGYDEDMSGNVSKASRVAFFGGSFDPPHLGHLAVARAARTALGLDLVLFTPVGTQPLKPHGATASFEDRLAMTRLAIAGETGFSISLVDAPSGSGTPNYTIDTLANLRAELALGAELFCLMGADSFLALQSWQRAAEVPFAAAMIVASRPGEKLYSLQSALPAGLTIETASEEYRVENGVEVRAFSISNATGDRSPFFLLPGLDVEISASEIRRRIQSQLRASVGAHGLLPPAVAEYVRARGLYR